MYFFASEAETDWLRCRNLQNS